MPYHAERVVRTGARGGHWSSCTHLKRYGINFAVFFARFLAYHIRPASVLEFGCGQPKGTATSYPRTWRKKKCSASPRICPLTLMKEPPKPIESMWIDMR